MTQYSKEYLKEDERLDDLERNGYKIIQNPHKFCLTLVREQALFRV